MQEETPKAGKRRRRGQRARRWWRNAALAALGLTVLGAGGFIAYKRHAADPVALFKRASTAFTDGKLAAAAVDLRADLAANGGDAPARVLLGRVYLKQGNAAAALKELSKARELGAGGAEVALGIARAQILLGKFDEAKAQFAAHGDETAPDWQATRGLLELGQRHFDQARDLFKQVLAQDPTHDEARRGLLQVALATGDLAAARHEIDTLLTANKKDSGLWVIKGALELEAKQLPDARQAYQHALDIAPKNLLANMGMAQTLLESADTKAAAARLDALGPDTADDPRVNFLRARVAEQRKDFNTALLNVNKVLHVAPNDRDSLVMAARLNFSLGQFSRAEEFAAQLLQLDPRDEAVKRLLVAIRLASGRLDDVNSDAAPDVSAAAASEDAGTLALLGTAYLKNGNYKDGEAKLGEAAKLAPDSLPIRVQLALGKLANGHAGEAIADLEALVTEHGDLVQARIMLALAYASQQRNAESIQAARALVAAKPDDALAHNVLGYVLELTGDKTAAGLEYHQALAKDDQFHPARINLARLALVAGDTQAASKHFAEVLARDEFNTPALLGMARLALAANNPDEAERRWQQAREHHAEAVAPRLALAAYYRGKANLPRAVEVIKEAYRLAPYLPAVQAEYTTVMLASGETATALTTARALAERAPQSLAVLELLSRAYGQADDEAGLTATLQKITKLKPEHEGAQTLLAHLALRHKDFVAAEQIATSLAAKPATAAAGDELRGDIDVARGERKAAATAYGRAFDSAPNGARVLKLERAERAIGVDNKRIEGWLAAHPDDTQVRLAQATTLQEQGADNAAISAYEQMLKVGPQHPVAMNNLAWLYFEREDGRAAEMARQAYQLAPRKGQIVDTYGWILFQQGKREQGLELLKSAAELTPGDPDIAFHVASALADSGQQGPALAKLHALLVAHQTFSLRQQAEALLARLDAQ